MPVVALVLGVALTQAIEYVIEGIPQMQVNAKAGLTFGEGVKGLLRLDPDVIFMGEMRDAISARAAIDAADSGHAFISTLHARDAAGIPHKPQPLPPPPRWR